MKVLVKYVITRYDFLQCLDWSLSSRGISCVCRWFSMWAVGQGYCPSLPSRPGLRKCMRWRPALWPNMQKYTQSYLWFMIDVSSNPYEFLAGTQKNSLCDTCTIVHVVLRYLRVRNRLEYNAPAQNHAYYCGSQTYSLRIQMPAMRRMKAIQQHWCVTDLHASLNIHKLKLNRSVFPGLFLTQWLGSHTDYYYDSFMIISTASFLTL